MEEHFDELARGITIESGKVLDDARGEMRRAVENVEVACGIPAMMLGDFSEDIARGIDEYMIRQPVGVVASICPLQLPGNDPLPEHLPDALACGNTLIIEPSKRTPLTMRKKSFNSLNRSGFPPVWSTWSMAVRKRQCHSGRSGHSGHHLCRLNPGCPPCLQLGAGQARSGPGGLKTP